MKQTTLFLLITTLLWLPKSYADITFNGFASIRASQANSDGGTEPFPEFIEGEVSFKSESLFGLQARADLGDNLSATIQLYAEGKNDFNVDARWAYISYQLNDHHQVNAGRFANPIFHQSEYEKVGYAHNFSRLPKAVYSNFEFATVEGLSLDSTFSIGDNTLTTKLLYGSWNGNVFIAAINSDVPLGFKDIFSVNATYSGDWWSIFSGVFIAELDGVEFNRNALAPAVASSIETAKQLGATDSEISTFNNAIGWDKKDGLYSFVGFNVDYSNWILDFEYTYYGVKDSSDGFNDTWFLALGRRIDDYIITIHTEVFNQQTDFSVFDNVSHPYLKAVAQATQKGLSSREFDGSGITVRYDFHPSAAFKIDYFKGNDTRSNVGDYSIISAGVDIVF